MSLALWLFVVVLLRPLVVGTSGTDEIVGELHLEGYLAPDIALQGDLRTDSSATLAVPPRQIVRGVVFSRYSACWQVPILNYVY